MATGIGQSRVAQSPAIARTAPETVAFDIPAQPLDAALDAYASSTGQSVLYDSHLTEGRTSKPLHGAYTPLAALDAMLEGSGLKVRYTSARALVLVRDAAPSPAPVDAASLQRYRGLLQSRVGDAFCADPLLAAGDRRIALRVWIAPRGAIERADLLDTTGDDDVDAAVIAALEGLSLGEALPAGAAQPFTLLIMPRSSGQSWRCPEPVAHRTQGRNPT